MTCPKCEDRGFVIVEHEGGTSEARLCDCRTAQPRRENYAKWATKRKVPQRVVRVAQPHWQEER